VQNAVMLALMLLVVPFASAGLAHPFFAVTYECVGLILLK